MKSAAGYFLALLRIFILTSIISKIKMGYKVGYLKKQKPRKQLVYVVFMVRCKGLEPLTYWFVASHSIQLS